MNTSILREIVDFADIVVMIFGIIGTVGGFVYWYDSNNIRTDVQKQLQNIRDNINQEIKNSAIILSSRLQKRQDSTTVRIETLEEEVKQLKTIFRCTSNHSLGECVKSIEPDLSKISKSLRDNTDFT